MYHFIGKDILYFHTLFWPAMLHFSDFRTPTNVFAHGFLTVDGEKMSKSRGTFITAHSFIEAGLSPEWLRYYFAAKLNASLEDLDLNLQDFVARVNSDLLGKYINIASRSAGFLVKRFDGIVEESAFNHPLILSLQSACEEIQAFYEAREFAKALRKTMELADQVNVYVDSEKPWEIAKRFALDNAPLTGELLQRVCSVTLEAFRILTIYLKPVLPQLAQDVEGFLNIPPLTFDRVHKHLLATHPIQPYRHLMSRVDQQMIHALLEANKALPL
jgi:methionyl-tRNA synthetase